jgi:hypothetical protein
MWGRKPLFTKPLFTDEELRRARDEALAATGHVVLLGTRVELLLPFVQLEEIRRLNDSTDKLLFVTVLLLVTSILLFLATLALLRVTVLLPY